VPIDTSRSIVGAIFHARILSCNARHRLTREHHDNRQRCVRSRAHHSATSTFTSTFSAARSCHCDLPDVHDIRLASQPWVHDARRSLSEAKINAHWQAGFAMATNVAVSYALSDADLATIDDGPLTTRELDIARLVAKGLRTREIAAVLFISPRTVDAHVEHIRDKLGFQSRVQIAAWVTEHAATKA